MTQRDIPTITVARPPRDYRELAQAASAAFGPYEFWCVHHPDDPLEDTASKDLIRPVRIVCRALDIDWDDLRERGWYLGKITLAGRRPAHKAVDKPT